MISFRKVFIINILLFILIGCSQVLETIELQSSKSEQLISAEQQNDFDIKIEPLTLAVAEKTKDAPYERKVMVSGVGGNANLFEESYYLNGERPLEIEYSEYTLGIGDELVFSNVDNLNMENMVGDTLQYLAPNNVMSDENILTSRGRVGSDGSILLLGIGSLQAKGKTITSLRSEVRNILVRKGGTPNFQLEISGFNSRKAFIFTSSGTNGVIPISDRGLTLKELAAQVGYRSKANSINLITLTRHKNKYYLSDADLFDGNRRPILIQNKDQIEIFDYPYKMGQVYALSGSRAKIIPITPEKRETMADAIFVAEGPLSNSNVKKSEIYLLRGKNPITAYHLDAQNASRILVAAAMELRPNDIIYVAQRPIISFSRLLQELSPLRFLLRDLRDDNIP